MNNLTLIGNLTRDPELREGAERPECKLRVAVDNGIYPPTFIDVRTFDAQAGACAAHLRRGRLVCVNGRLALDEFRGSDGRPRQRYSVIGRVEFLDKPWSGDGQPARRPADPEPIGSAQPELALAA